MHLDGAAQKGSQLPVFIDAIDPRLAVLLLFRVPSLFPEHDRPVLVFRSSQISPPTSLTLLAASGDELLLQPSRALVDLESIPTVSVCFLSWVFVIRVCLWRDRPGDNLTA